MSKSTSSFTANIPADQVERTPSTVSTPATTPSINDEEILKTGLLQNTILSGLHTFDCSCHCGSITYKIEADLSQRIKCNCTYCIKVHRYDVPSEITMTSPPTLPNTPTGEDIPNNMMRYYQYGQKRVKHYFCGNCGIRVLSRGDVGFGELTMAALGTIKGVNFKMLKDVGGGYYAGLDDSFSLGKEPAEGGFW